MLQVKIPNLEGFNFAFGSVGQSVGSRTGPNKRTKDDKEWYVVRNFLKAVIPKGLLVPPICIRKGCPPDPDFIVVGADANESVALIEITEATDETDQRERTAIERSGRPTLLGTFGGRQAANPEEPWARDVIDAMKRKRGKAIFLGSHPSRHLIIYPNSNMSMLLSDDEDERKAISMLRSAVTREGNPLTQIVNGCFVHVLGAEYVCVDILGRMCPVRRG